MPEEKRFSIRFESKVNLNYQMIYDLDTKVKFSSMSESLANAETSMWVAKSQDVSLEGLSFVSPKALSCGDLINLDVFIPSSEESVPMEGEVRWSYRLPEGNAEMYKTGIKILTVRGKSVESSIYFDEQYHVQWSSVLDTILGQFSKLSQGRHKGEEE